MTSKTLGSTTRARSKVCRRSSDLMKDGVMPKGVNPSRDGSENEQRRTGDDDQWTVGLG